MEKNNNLLLVDDEKQITNSLKRLLRKENHSVYIANSGKQGLEVLKNFNIGVVISDLMMPEMDGLTFFEYVQKVDKEIVQILLTAHATLDSTLASINRLNLFGYLTKPWSVDELKNTISKAFEHYNLRVENKLLQKLTKKQNKKLKEINKELENKVRRRTLLLEEALHEGIILLANAAEAKDGYTGEHIHRIHALTLDICIGMGMHSHQSERISSFSMIHDVGKIHIPDFILNKSEQLDKNEQELMKTHTIEGEKILGVKSFYMIARQIARSHHENWNGSGYPDELKGDKIPLPARIVAIANKFDDLTYKSPYKEAWTHERVLEEMKRLSGSKFDPEIMAIFLKIQKKKAMRMI